MIAQAFAWIRRKVNAQLVTRGTVHGIPIAVHNDRVEFTSDEIIARIDRVLQVIADARPVRYQKLSRDFAMIVVQRFYSRGAYFPSHRVVLLDLVFVGGTVATDTEIAATIIHEATHAQLHRLGLEMGGPEAERCCRRAEIRFGRSTPEGASVVQRASSALEATDDEEVAPTVDQDLAWRRVAAADLTASPGPRWLKRIVAKRRGLNEAPDGTFHA